jgi:hypothetical protein
MFRFAFSSASAALLTIALCCTYQNATAQTQMQGMTATSPPLGSQVPGPAPANKPTSTKAKRAECVSQGENQGLKGRDLKKFVQECVKKPAS